MTDELSEQIKKCRKDGTFAIIDQGLASCKAGATYCVFDIKDCPKHKPPRREKPYPTAKVYCNLVNCTIQYGDKFPSECLRVHCDHLQSHSGRKQK